jgi:hypothetical protein
MLWFAIFTPIIMSCNVRCYAAPRGWFAIWFAILPRPMPHRELHSLGSSRPDRPMTRPALAKRTLHLTLRAVSALFQKRTCLILWNPLPSRLPLLREKIARRAEPPSQHLSYFP